jgi:hypothetical protein
LLERHFYKRLEIKRSSKEWRLFIEMEQPLPAELINQTHGLCINIGFFLIIYILYPALGSPVWSLFSLNARKRSAVGKAIPVVEALNGGSGIKE